MRALAGCAARVVAVPAVTAVVCLSSPLPLVHAAPDVAEVSVAVRITSFTPMAPKPGDTVKITGAVTNTGTTTLTNTQALACVDRDRITDRGELAALPPQGDDCKGLTGTGAYHDFADVLEPKVSRPFSITVPWTDWRLGSNRAGVYVVGVRINGDNPDGGREHPAIARTLMPVVAPDAKLRTVRTAMMLPLRHRPTQLNGTYFADESLNDALKPDGRLGQLVHAGTGKQVSWLIDPSVLDEARQLAASYGTDPKDAKQRQNKSQAAADWLAALDRAVSPPQGHSPVALLPYGDPDVRTLEAARLGSIVDGARELTAGVERPPAGKPVQSAVWLENGSANDATLSALAADHPGSRPGDLTLLSSWAWAPDERPDLDGSPIVDVTTSAGTVRAVVADQGLTSGGPDPAVVNGPVQVRQRFAAETALIALSEGTTPVTVVAAPARGFDLQGSATGVLLQGLSLPWITPIGIDQVTGPAATTVAAPAPKPAITALNQQQLSAVREISDDVATFNDLATNSIAFKQDLNRRAARAASMSWRGFGGDGDRYRHYQLGVYFRPQFASVHIVTTDGGDGTVVTLSASKGQFPLTIENGMKRPVKVGLRIESVNRDDLSVENIEPRVIRGGNRYSFTIRASAQQNGLIKARAYVITEDGHQLGAPLELDIRAAQYGTVGWVLVASAVALLFGTSAIRIFRRVRKERRTTIAPAAGPEAVAIVDTAGVIDVPAAPEVADPAQAPATATKGTDG